jgi:hypothetical protein
MVKALWYQLLSGIIHGYAALSDMKNKASELLLYYPSF